MRNQAQRPAGTRHAAEQHRQAGEFVHKCGIRALFADILNSVLQRGPGAYLGTWTGGMNQVLVDRQAVIADGGARQVLGLQVSAPGADHEAIFVLHVGVADVKHPLSLRGDREQRPQVHFPVAQRLLRTTRLQYPLQVDSVAPRRVRTSSMASPVGPPSAPLPETADPLPSRCDRPGPGSSPSGKRRHGWRLRRRGGWPPLSIRRPSILSISSAVHYPTF